MLTAPAADGTVKVRSLIRTSGAVASGERGMASIGRLYRGAGWLRKGWCGIAILLAVATPALGTPPRIMVPAGVPRLLVLGDSLSAGYGLPHDQGFEVQLQQALKAQGHDVTIIDGAV